VTDVKGKDSHTKDAVEKFKFEVAEELGVIEQSDCTDCRRNAVKQQRPPHHRHVKRGK
jgi:hypothetical protein